MSAERPLLLKAYSIALEAPSKAAVASAFNSFNYVRKETRKKYIIVSLQSQYTPVRVTEKEIA